MSEFLISPFSTLIPSNSLRLGSIKIYVEPPNILTVVLSCVPASCVVIINHCVFVVGTYINTYWHLLGCR